MFDIQNWEFSVISPPRLSKKKNKKKQKKQLTSRQLSPKEKHNGAFTHGTIIRSFYSSMLYRSKNDQGSYFFRFSIFRYILFIQVDTETFVHLTSTYTLTLGVLRWGWESVYPS